MQTDAAYDHLNRHQLNILRILTDASRALRQPDASNMKVLALIRWELMRALREYQLFKHTEIFDPLIAAGRAPRASAAARLKERCIEMAEIYGEHVRRWSMQGSTHAWEAYESETKDMIQRIERHLASELREVHLALSGMTRLRTA